MMMLAQLLLRGPNPPPPLPSPEAFFHLMQQQLRVDRGRKLCEHAPRLTASPMRKGQVLVAYDARTKHHCPRLDRTGLILQDLANVLLHSSHLAILRTEKEQREGGLTDNQSPRVWPI